MATPLAASVAPASYPAGSYPPPAISNPQQMAQASTGGGYNALPTSDQITNPQELAQASTMNPAQVAAVQPTTAPTPPPPPPGAGFMTPAMMQYIAQFKASQAAQQQAINAGLMSAISDLGQRRDAAARVAAALPGQVNATYNEVNADTARQNAREAAAGGGTPGGTSDIQALINEQHASEKKSGLASEPLMQAGITADYTKGHTTLENQKMANDAAVAERQSQFDAQIAMQQAQFQQQQQLANEAYMRQVAGARLNASLQAQGEENRLTNAEKLFAFEHPGGYVNPQAADLMQQQNAAAIKKGYPDWQTMQNAATGPYFQALVTALGQKKTVPVEGANFSIHGGDRNTVIQQVAQSNQWVLRALLDKGVITQQDLVNAGLQAQPPTPGA